MQVASSVTTQPDSTPATALSMAASQRLSFVLLFAISTAFFRLLSVIAVSPLWVVPTDKCIPPYELIPCQEKFIGMYEFFLDAGGQQALGLACLRRYGVLTLWNGA